MNGPLLIVGASARAAAASARRAGMATECFDLFADRDLVARGPAARVASLSRGLFAAVRGASSGPWMYTGGMENQPRAIERISTARELLGVPAPVLNLVRNPFWLAGVARTIGLSVPEIASEDATLPRDGTWLRKPFRSSGGRGIERWYGTPLVSRQVERHYFQACVRGTPCAAVYIAARGAARLIGITEQLIGTGDAAAESFAYAGTIGPLPVSSATQTRFERLGHALAREAELAGLFGVDAILVGDDVRPLEVNPRYTASVEVLERALGVSTLPWHVAACRHAELPDVPRTGDGRLFGKQIVFAQHACEVPVPASNAWLGESVADSPTMADIPWPGEKISRGQPVVSLFDSDVDRSRLQARLAQRAREVLLQLDTAA